MPKKQHVIYLPGLADHVHWADRTQRSVLKLWNKFGVITHYHQLNWIDSEPFDSKLIAILEQIDQLASDGHKVSLVGVSAGASAALNAYCSRKDKVASVVFICGKLQRPQTISPNLYHKNPAFKESIYLAQKLIPKLTPEDKAKMLSLHPIADSYVPVEDSKIDGVRDKTVLAIGHVPGIAVALIFYPRSMIRFLRKRINQG